MITDNGEQVEGNLERWKDSLERRGMKCRRQVEKALRIICPKSAGLQVLRQSRKTGSARQNGADGEKFQEGFVTKGYQQRSKERFTRES